MHPHPRFTHVHHQQQQWPAWPMHHTQSHARSPPRHASASCHYCWATQICDASDCQGTEAAEPRATSSCPTPSSSLPKVKPPAQPEHPAAKPPLMPPLHLLPGDNRCLRARSRRRGGLRGHTMLLAVVLVVSDLSAVRANEYMTPRGRKRGGHGTSAADRRWEGRAAHACCAAETQIQIQCVSARLASARLIVGVGPWGRGESGSTG